MGKREAITSGPSSLVELAQRVLADLDPNLLGLPWLCTDSATRIMLSDYLADALATTRQDLREAQLGLGQFNLAVAAAERRTRRQLRKTAGTDPVPPPCQLRVSLCRHCWYDVNHEHDQRGTGGPQAGPRVAGPFLASG